MLNQLAAKSLALAVARPFLMSKFLFRQRIVALASPEELEVRRVEMVALPVALPAGEAGRWMENIRFVS